MGALKAGNRSEVEERQARLLRLHWELTRLGVRVSVRKPRNGRWKLRLRAPGWSETVLCAGAEGTYAYVTIHGRVLGPAEDVRYVARLLVWMLERKRRRIRSAPSTRTPSKDTKRRDQANPGASPPREVTGRS